ncbi:MAG: hypothetical protein KC619_23715 [Myxococcales bacterium]|nr:hypothetical protein [Myxococcales bacterium]
MNRTVSFALFALALSIPGLASAQRTERPVYVGGAAGAAIELDRYPTQGVVIEEIGWHFLGTTDGPFVGLTLAEGFGNDVFTFQATPRFGWDISLLRGDVGVLLAPSAAVGVAVAAVTVNTGFGSASGSQAFFDAQGAIDVRFLLLEDQLGLFIRPVAVDVFIHENGAAVRWNALAGAAYHF